VDDRAGDDQVLEPLRRHEAELDARLETARRDAETVLAAAAEEAARIARAAEAALAEELAGLRAAAAAELEQRTALGRAAAGRAAGALRERAAQRREAALARVIDVVRGAGP
jgi:hypothetical protein